MNACRIVTPYKLEQGREFVSLVVESSAPKTHMHAHITASSSPPETSCPPIPGMSVSRGIWEETMVATGFMVKGSSGMGACARREESGDICVRPSDAGSRGGGGGGNSLDTDVKRDAQECFLD